MGDERPQRSQPQLTESDEIIALGAPPQSLTNTAFQQGAQSANMEFEPFSQQQFGAESYLGAMDMRSVENALPAYPIRTHPHQPFQHQIPHAPGSNQSIMYSYPPGTQFAGQTTGNFTPNFFHQYPPQYMQNQHPRHHQQAFPQFMGSSSTTQASHAHQNANFSIHPGMLQNVPSGGQQHPHHFVQNTSAQFGLQSSSRSGSGYQVPQVRLDSSMMAGAGFPVYQQLSPHPVRRTSSNSSLQGSVLRGPPRKPKQSGHALWVGNLPPGTHIIDLKDHFSRDATEDIESVFLIAKSNCAFVNYKTEASCTAAMSRFHDSRFQGVRLVCRLRRGSAPTSGTSPSGPRNTSPVASNQPADVEVEDGDQDNQTETVEVAGETTEVADVSEKVKEKFFVVKSLTIEDLERSMQSGVWATQAHNEFGLNKAYETAESVYLIFSANKSGEYFGYARMDSAIDDEAASTIEYPTRLEASQPSPSDLPVAIPTPPSATAPKGRIIDDSARGTIFWEADQEEKEAENKEDDTGAHSGEGEESGASASASPAIPQAFGKPFKIVWISTERLPFYRTRGLRNPWNANREVKIARDGTEIEPSVGRRLISMFHHRPQMTSTSPTANRQPAMVPIQGGYMTQQGQAQGGMYGRPY